MLKLQLGKYIMYTIEALIREKYLWMIMIILDLYMIYLNLMMKTRR